MKETLRRGLMYALIPATFFVVYEGGRVHQQYIDQAAARPVINVANSLDEREAKQGSLLTAKQMADNTSPIIYSLAHELDNIIADSDFSPDNALGSPTQARKQMLPYPRIVSELDKIEIEQRVDLIYDKLSPIINGLASPDHSLRVRAKSDLDQIIEIYRTSHALEIREVTRSLTQRFGDTEAGRIRDIVDKSYK